MKVSQAVELAREWVELEGSKTPGFHGAHLMGSLVTMPQGAPFPTWKDVDLSIVVPDGTGYESGRENVELIYEGLILEVSFHELARYCSPEAVLARPGLASCFTTNSILSDPVGTLEALRKTVARDYTRRKWVLARCEYEKRRFWDDLEAMQQASSAPEVGLHMLSAVRYVTGMVAVAHLRQPTHRRCLILMGELLDPLGRLDLCEETLSVMGWEQMDRVQVESYLQQGARAFDRAVEVHRTPSPLGFKLRPHVRPYLVQAAQEMIDEGYHREAMWWIHLFHYLCNVALQNDAPEKERPVFQARFDCLLEDMGLSTPEDWAARVEQARALAVEVFRVADEIAAQNPEIVG